MSAQKVKRCSSGTLNKQSRWRLEVESSKPDIGFCQAQQAQRGMSQDSGSPVRCDAVPARYRNGTAPTAMQLTWGGEDVAVTGGGGAVFGR